MKTRFFSILFLSMLLPRGTATATVAGSERPTLLADGSAVPSDADFTPARLISMPGPDYGDLPSGKVAIEVIVGMKGGVAAVAVIEATDPALVDVALTAAESAVFAPARLAGEPVAVRHELRYVHERQ